MSGKQEESKERKTFLAFDTFKVENQNMKRGIPLPIITIILSGSLFLASCGKEPPEIPPLPEGIQTMTGVLLPTGISTLRRGTHILKFQDKVISYVESSTVNLRTFEGREVLIRGTFEYNTNKTDLPVLVATNAEEILRETKELSLPAFGMTATIPQDWVATTELSVVHIQQDKVNQNILTIKSAKPTALPPQGIPFILDNKHAVRVKNEKTGGEAATVLVDDHMIVFEWLPPVDSKDSFDSQWFAFLETVKFSSQNSSSSTLETGSGSSGIPCGGTAGILCPAGQYCAITDIINNIGKCRKAK